MTMNRNLSTKLKKRRRPQADPMAAYDRLPPEARAWAAQAVLPWSAQSVRKIWSRALQETGCKISALSRLDAAEQATLSKEIAPSP